LEDIGDVSLVAGRDIGYRLFVIGLNLRALGEAGSDGLSTFDAELIRCKIEARHSPIVGRNSG
jgi:hypothetical protein